MAKYTLFVLKALFYLLLLLYIFSFSLLDVSSNFNDRLSKVLYDKDGEIIAYSTNKEGFYYFKTYVDDVDPLYLDMLIASEDKRFNYHLGVDPFAICRAFIQNIKYKRVKSGASTIAMQTAKLLYQNKRTFKAKIKESILATALTLYYGRERVLSMYLTMLPFGSSINSTKAASYFLLKKNAKHLSIDEAATLVAIPKNPRYISSIYKENLKRNYFYKKTVLKSAYLNNVISYDVYKEALKAQSDIVKCDASDFKTCLFEQRAYYFGQFVFEKSKKHEFFSYIDSNVQNNLIKNANAFKYLHNDNNTNLGIVVIDNKENKLIGYIGGILDEAFNVDVSRSNRSSASTLKPFIYAKAFDKKIILPNSFVDDKELKFNLWTVKNYDNKYRGKVLAKDALANSLNPPAVSLLERINASHFIHAVNEANDNLKCRDNSLAIALGSCSVNLVDLTYLYTMFSNEGVLKPTKLFYTNVLTDKKINKHNVYVNTKINKEYKFVDKDSSNAILQILKTTKRPHNSFKYMDLSYKAGTSYNYKDALSIGFKNSYTIGIRAIKLKNDNSEIKGYEDVSPLLFSIFDSLNLEHDNLEYESNLFNESLNSDTLSHKTTDDRSFAITYPLNNAYVLTVNNKIYIDYDNKSGQKLFLYVNDVLQENTHVFSVYESGFYTIKLVNELNDKYEIKIEVKIE